MKTLRSVLLALFVASTLAAQEHPVLQKGFVADKVYQFGGIDAVNTFNGNLTLTIPIGPSYPVGGQLSYALTLSYNSKVWSYVEVTNNCAAVPGCRPRVIRAEPNQRSNAGLGWLVSLGRMVPPENPWAHYPNGGYQSADGGEHAFYGGGPHADPASTDYDGPRYTRDNTYIRQILNSAGSTLQFSDGREQEFDSSGALTRMTDQFGNALDVRRIAPSPELTVLQSNQCSDYTPYNLTSAWELTDSQQRKHYICFSKEPHQSPNPRSIYGNETVKVVALSAPEGTWAKYRFTYIIPDGGVRRGCHSTLSNDTLYVYVPLLSRLELPDGTAYTAHYNGTSDTVDLDPNQSSVCAQGTLRSLHLPTAGILKYTYDYFQIPGKMCTTTPTVFQYVTGVGKRTLDDGTDHPPTWTYTREYSERPAGSHSCGSTEFVILSMPNPSEAMASVVTAPDGTVEKTWYSIWPFDDQSPNHYDMHEFSLPLARHTSKDDTFLSTETRSASGSLLRRTFVKYEHDASQCEGVDEDFGFNPDCFDADRRILKEQSVHFDGVVADGSPKEDRVASTTYSDFDGYGHFRLTTTGGTFDGQNARSVRTEYNPGSNALGRNTDGTLVFPADRPWRLNFYTDSCAVDVSALASCNGLTGSYRHTYVCFDPLDFMTRQRTVSGSATIPRNPSLDLLTIFERDDSGNVTAESYFGGDHNPIGGSDACDATTSDAEYRISHTYKYGVRESSWYVDQNGSAVQQLLKMKIDPSGVPVESTDSAGLETKYSYDGLFRLRRAEPKTATITLKRASTTTFLYETAKVTVEELGDSNRLLAHRVYLYDPLGRLREEQVQLPDGSTSVRATVYDVMGRKWKVSELGTVAEHFTIFTYDAFGRPVSVTTPDDKTTTNTYTGVSKMVRKSTIWSFPRLNGTYDRSQPASEQPTSTTEVYDRHGRLAAVTEPADNQDVTTSYTYDVNDHLISVSQGVQSRTFKYDNRGFLLEEDHPESNAITYGEYDSRGHARTRSIAGEPQKGLRFTFDRTERLTFVEAGSENAWSPLKRFVFAPPRVSDSEIALNAGKLSEATRHNNLGDRDVVVTDSYTYGGREASVKNKSTCVEERSTVTDAPCTAGATARVFDTEYSFDEASRLDSVTYPSCTGCGVSGPARTITNTYEQGLLQSVAAGTKTLATLSYAPNRMLREVAHGAPNNVIDTITPDAWGMPRPKRITFNSANDCSVISSESADKLIGIGESATFTISAPGATFAWYQGASGDKSKPVGNGTGSFTTPQLDETTTYWCLVTGPVCSRNSRLFTATVCVPKITSPAHDYNGAATAVEEGSSLTLQIAVNGDGWTYKWEQAPVAVDANGNWTSNGAASIIGTSDSLLTWSAPAFITSGPNVYGLFVTVTGSCSGVTRLVKVFEVQDAVPCLAPATRTIGQTVSGAKVILTVPDDHDGVTFLWFEGSDYDDMSKPLGTGPTIEVSPTTATSYWVLMTRICPFTSVSLPTPRLTVQPPPGQTVQRIDSYQKFNAIYAPGDAAQLWVNMDPAPSADHVYHYEWYRDDPAGATRLTPDVSNPYVTTQSVNTFWVKIRGTHAGTTGEQITISPKMYLSVSGVCDLPPLYLTQNRTTVPVNSSPDVTFVATCDWPNTSFQWYRGQSGDTRDPISSHAGPPNQLTVGSFTIYPYWVRVTRDDCGAYTDSPTLSFERDGCGPVLINQDVPSVDVAYDTTAFLTVEPPSFGSATYTWHREDGSTVPGSGPTLVLPHVKESGRYFVHIGNSLCDRSAGMSSFLATVRVASSPSIAPPQWQTEVWTDKNSSIVLSAQAGGATDYQWYAGEVGDKHLPISGATSATYTTPVLTAETKYWVRISGPNNELVDSPTITVKVCDAPHAAGGASTARQDINAGQFVTFSFPTAGTDLTYQWYEGPAGNTSLKRGRSIDHLQVHPTVTTTYWVRVTGHCGVGGTDARSIDSPLFTAAVCPVLETATAAQSRVMLHGRTTLSIVAQGAVLSYQWYEGNPGDKSKPVVNGNAASVQSPEILQATTFWCEVIGVGGCARTSNEVSVQLCDVPAINWSAQIHTNAQPNEFQAINFFPVDPGVPYSFSWYAGPAGDVANSQLLAVNNSTAYGVQPATTTTYWVRMTLTDSPCYSDSPGLTINVCIPRITGQPVAPSTTIASGTPATLTVTTSALSGQTFQWYAGAAGVTSSPVNGATSATLTITPTVTTTYWVRVNGTCSGIYRDSDAATVNVCSPPQITSVSPTQFIASGTSTYVSIGTSAASPSFKWYIGASGTKTNPIANSNSTSIPVSPAATTSYWAEVTSAGVCVTNGPAIVVNVCTPPSFTLQPQSQAIFSGKAATLTAAASSSTGTVTYQWYTGVAGDTSAPINGAVSATLTVTPAVETSYWVRATTSVCTADSNTAVVTICLYPQVVDGNPSEKLIGYGASTTIALPTMSPVADKYVTWYRGVSGDHTTILGGALNLSSYTTPALTATTQYWAEFTNGGCTSRTNTYTVRVCVPAITTQPSGTTISAGSSATLTAVTTNITGQTFQWYVGTPGTTTSPLAGATSSSLTITPASTTTYWLRVTGTCGVSADSTAATVTVCNPPVITSTSPTRYIESGTPTSVSVNATGSNLTFQWYLGNSGVTTSPISGAVSASCTVSPTTTTTYWCRIMSAGVCPTNSPTLTVDVCNKPSITTQPVSSRVFSGKPTTLTVAATSPRPLSYQWYAGISGDTASPINGATSASVTVSPTIDTNYWVRVTTSVCFIDSATATLSMCTYPEVITPSPAQINLASGQSTTLTLPPLSPVDNKTVTWYRGASGDKSQLLASALNLNSYTTPALTATTQYWAEFTNNTCVSRTTTWTVAVCKPTITAQPQSTTVPNGGQATLSVTATGAPLTYQWYLGSSGNTASPISGATNSSYTTPALTSSTTYWVRVSGCATADSTAATVSICNTPTITNLTKTATHTPGGTGSVTVTATGTGLTYQWYKGQSGDTTRIINGATAATYTFGLTMSEYYWVRVTTSCNGTSANSAAIMYSVDPTIATQPQSVSIPSGTTTTLSVQANGTYLSYKWYSTSTGTIAGATSATYTTPALTSETGYYCVVTSGTTAVAYSTTATVSICTGPAIANITKQFLGGTSWRVTVSVYSPDDQNVKYLWYRGVPGNVAQSTFIGEGGTYLTLVTPAQSTTYWVRVAWLDDTCYSDTAGVTIP